MGNNLILHAGGWQATEEEVRAVPVPQTTSSYTPVAYGDFLDCLHEAVRAYGLDWGRVQLGLGAHGNRLFGVLDAFDVDAVADTLDPTQHGLAIGFRGSYDRSFSNQLAAGSRVFVCDNLSFYGDVVYRRKHTLNVWRDLPRGIEQMLAKVQGKRQRFEELVEKMHARMLGRAEAHDLLVQAIKIKALPPQQLLRVLEEYRQPSTPELRTLDPTAWKLYNAVTSVAKTWSPRSLMDNTTRLSGLFGEYVGVPLGENMN